MIASKYTSILKNLLDSNFDIGLKDYPIFDEAYRAVLNEKIKNHFLYREIGYETPQMFKHYINTKMSEIMDLYNQMYASQVLIFNPMYDFATVENSTHQTDGAGSALSDACNNATSNNQTATESTDTGTTLSVESDTPQALLSQANILGNNYASRANRGVSDTAAAADSTSASVAEVVNHDTTSSTNTNLDTYISSKSGNSGAKNFSELLLDFRATFINIDMLIVNDLSVCFMGVW